MSDQLVQQSDCLSDKKQAMLQVLADNERSIDKSQADIDIMSQQKLEQLSAEQKLTDNDQEIINLKEQINVKDETLTEQKEILMLEEQTREESEKVSDLQQELAVKEQELVATKNEMSNLHHQLLQQSDLLSATMTSYADKQQASHYVLADKEKIIEELQADNEKYKSELNDAKDFMQQLKNKQLSMEQKLDDKNKEMIDRLRVKDEVLAELKDELISKQNCFDAAVNRQSNELEELQKVTQEQSEEILNLQKQIAQKQEELVVTRNEMSDLHQQCNDLSTEIACKQTMEHELADKERIINTLQANIVWYKSESNNAKNLMQQLKIEQLSMKQEIADSKKEMMEKLRVKDQALAEWQEELLSKESSFDAAVCKHSDEMKELQRVTQEHMDNILALQEEVARKEEELAVTRNKMSDLHHELMQQSEHLNAEIADKQTMKHELADKNQIIDKLQAGVTMYEVELDNAKDSLSQLKMEWSSMKQEFVDSEKEMMDKIKVKDEALAKLNEELVMKQNCLDHMNITITKQSNKLDEWQKDSQEQLEKISTLQQEVAVKEEELNAANSEMSNLHHGLVQQSDLMSATMTSYADKQQASHYVLADKEKIIDELQADNERYNAELNSAKDFMQQLADNKKEMMEKLSVKDDELADLNKELIMKQNCLDITASKHSTELEEWQKERQERSDKILALQKEIAEKEEELAVTREEITDLNDQLAKQSDLLSAEIADKQETQNILARKEKINWRVVDKLEADKEMYKAQLNDAEELIKQVKTERLSMEQKFADNQKEMIEKMEVKEKALTELKKQLTEKQNSFDIAVSTYQDEMKELQKVTQEQLLTLQKSIAEKHEELVVTRNEMSDLHHQLAQKSDLLSAEIEEKQTMKHELTDKERTIDMLQADNATYKVELNNAKDFMSQLKMEQLSMKQQLADNEKDMIEKLRVKDESLAKLKEELIIKQDSLADMNITIRKRTNDLEEWQKESEEQVYKIVALQHEVEEKGEELVTTKSEMSNLHHRLLQQSDLLSTAMTSYAEKEQTFQSALADKERIIDELQDDIEMYTAKLNDGKNSIKVEQVSVKQELKKEMMEKIRAKDEALAELKEQLITKQNILDAAVSKHSVELTEWQKQSAEQSDKIVTLQQEVAEKQEELVATKNETTDVNDELTQQSDLLSAEVAYTQTLKHTLADKERIIEQLNKDIATHQTEVNNIKSHMSELEKEHLSVKQELADKKETTGKISVKNEALGKLKVEMFAKQNSLVDASIVKKQSIELDMLQMKSQGQLDKIKALKREVHNKGEELLATKSKMSNLKQKIDQLSGVIADKDRIIKKLEAEIEMYKSDAKGLTSQSKVEELSVKHELATDNTKKEMLECNTPTEAKAGASVVQNKEKQPNQPKDVQQEAKREDRKVNEKLSVKHKLAADNSIKEMQLASWTPTEAKAGASVVQNKEKQPKAVGQEAKREEGKVNEKSSVKHKLAADNSKKEMQLASWTPTEAKAGASVVQNKEKQPKAVGQEAKREEGKVNEKLSVKHKLAADNSKKEMLLECNTPTEAKAGASVVQNKEKQPNQPKDVQQEAKREEGKVNEKSSVKHKLAADNSKKEMQLASWTPTEAKAGASVVQNKEKQPKAVRQEAKREEGKVNEKLSVKHKVAADNSKKEMLLESWTPTEAKAGASVVQNKEKQPKAVRQEAKREEGKVNEKLSVKHKVAADNSKTEMLLESWTPTEAKAGASVVQNKEKQPNQPKDVQQEAKREDGKVNEKLSVKYKLAADNTKREMLLECNTPTEAKAGASVVQNKEKQPNQPTAVQQETERREWLVYNLPLRSHTPENGKQVSVYSYSYICIITYYDVFM